MVNTVVTVPCPTPLHLIIVFLCLVLTNSDVEGTVNLYCSAIKSYSGAADCRACMKGWVGRLDLETKGSSRWRPTDNGNRKRSHDHTTAQYHNDLIRRRWWIAADATHDFNPFTGDSSDVIDQDHGWD